MTKKYKAIITDVDGTLIPNRKDGEISPKVTGAIHKAKSHIHFGLATSRDREDVYRISSHLSLSGPSIIYGGCWIIEARSQEVLWKQNIEIDAFMEAYTIAKQLGFYFVVNDNGKKYKPEQEYISESPINIWGHGLTHQQLQAFLKRTSHLSTISTHAIPSWKEGKIDFITNHALATKQHAVFEVSKLLGIKTDEIIGIGDGANDIPLLMACGMKVAVGNAVEDLKAIADYIAPSVEEDGIADVIEKFIFA